MSDAPEGWNWLRNSRKWHYFRNNRSLCQMWIGLFPKGQTFETDNDESPDNCAACRRARLAEKAKA